MNKFNWFLINFYWVTKVYCSEKMGKKVATLVDEYILVT